MYRQKSTIRKIKKQDTTIKAKLGTQTYKLCLKSLSFSNHPRVQRFLCKLRIMELISKLCSHRIEITTAKDSTISLIGTHKSNNNQRVAKNSSIRNNHFQLRIKVIHLAIFNIQIRRLAALSNRMRMRFCTIIRLQIQRDKWMLSQRFRMSRMKKRSVLMVYFRSFRLKIVPRRWRTNVLSSNLTPNSRLIVKRLQVQGSQILTLITHSEYLAPNSNSKVSQFMSYLMTVISISRQVLKWSLSNWGLNLRRSHNDYLNHPRWWWIAISNIDLAARKVESRKWRKLKLTNFRDKVL